jgi:polysaccharide pyruvyl transferase WcaK-like protein
MSVQLKTIKNGVRSLANRLNSKGKKARRRYGYIGANNTRNLGDEAVFIASRLYLPELMDFKYQIEPSLAKIGLSGENYFDKVALGGGTLISKCPGIYEHIQCALKLGIPLFAFGTGVGSSGFDESSTSDVSYFAEPLKRFIRVGVRGYRSQTVLQSWGLDNVSVVGDTALSLTPEIPPTSFVRKRIAFNVALPAGLNRQEYDSSIASISSALTQLSTAGHELVPIAMVPSDVDAAVAASAGAFRRSDVKFLTQIDQFFDIVGSCHLLLGVRLHAAILASCIGVPPILLGYRDKCADFMESMDLANLLLNFETVTADAILEKISYIESSDSDIRTSIHAKALHWKRTQADFIKAVAPELAVDFLQV